MNGETIGAWFARRIDDRSVRHDLSRVQPNADRHGLVAEPRRIPDRQRRLTSEQCVAFLRPGGAEESKNAIAQSSNDCAFAPLDGLAHRVKCRFQALHRVFGIEPRYQFGRTDNVREQHRHLLEFAPSASDVRSRRDVMRRSSQLAQSAPARAAEGRTRRILMRAGRTCDRKRRTAVLTEAVRRRILFATLLTKHPILLGVWMEDEFSTNSFPGQTTDREAIGPDRRERA